MLLDVDALCFKRIRIVMRTPARLSRVNGTLVSKQPDMQVVRPAQNFSFRPLLCNLQSPLYDDLYWIHDENPPIISITCMSLPYSFVPRLNWAIGKASKTWLL